MARVITPMQITAVDADQNLFRIEHVFPQHLAHRVLSMPWTELAWDRQTGQETWPRRRIRESELPWINEWHDHMIGCVWPSIIEQTGRCLDHYRGTAFWVDEPGFTCDMHTDGELPGSLHLIWAGSGTTFYWYNSSDTVRFQTPATANSGYLMFNQADEFQYRRLLWHAMLTPVPENSLRLTTYTAITLK